MKPMTDINSTNSTNINNLFLSERVILVTGASMGIGRAVSKALAAQGATVILLARNIKRLETLYDEIEASIAPTPAIYPFNLVNATPKDYEDLKDNIEKNFGRLDGLLHNAACLGSLTPIEYTDIKQWYEVLQLNLNSAFLLTKALIPLLKKSLDASVVFTSADLGKKAKAHWGAYAVSKFGIEGLMQVLADELENHTSIRVNSFNPKIVRTSLRASAYPAEDPKKLPLPESLVSHYIYLLGPESKGVTGQSLEA